MKAAIYSSLDGTGDHGYRKQGPQNTFPNAEQMSLICKNFLEETQGNIQLLQNLIYQ
ncbi:hypothetical protein STEG23_036362, partial [Scotinomys teguina]